MELETYNTAKQALLTAAFALAPTSREQEGFVKMVQEMDRACETHELILIQLITSLTDGAIYGNWPYTPRPQPLTPIKMLEYRGDFATWLVSYISAHPAVKDIKFQDGIMCLTLSNGHKVDMSEPRRIN